MKYQFKRIVSFILAAGMMMNFCPQIAEYDVFAIDNIAAQTDFSDAETLSITDDTTIKLTTGETRICSTITIASGKTLTIKGGGSLIADKISGGKVEINSGTVSANNVSSSVTMVSGSLCTTESTGSVTISGGTFQSDSLKAALNISNGTANIGTIAASGSIMNITGGTVEVGSVSCKDINIAECSFSCTSVKASNITNISGGTVTADTIEGGAVVISGGTVEAATISGNDGGPVIISAGDVKTDTLKGGDGNANEYNSYIINDVMYSKKAGGIISIKGGTVEINQGLYAGNASSNNNVYGGNVNIIGGKVTVIGDVIAGNGPSFSSKITVTSSSIRGGSIYFSENADIEVNGNLTAGNGGSLNGRINNSGGNGGNITIHGGKIIGTITSGNGGVSGYSTNYDESKICGGTGGEILIDGGEIYGNLISGNGGNRYIYGNSENGNGGNITLNSGKINIKNGITLGTGYTSGYLKTSSDGTAVITTSSVPSLKYFTSGVIKISGDISVYGKQTFTSDEYLDEYDTLTLYNGAELTVSGSELKVNGELQNNGSIIINADADLTGTGTYIYDNEEISIPELKEKLIGEKITISDSIVYDGADHKESISVESKEAYGIKFMGMDLSNYNISLSYSKTADGEKESTETAINAGYYTVLVKNSSDELIASKDFEITHRELSVESVKVTENEGEITGINFSGLVDGEALEFGTDYTVNDAVIEGEVVTGIINLLDTPVAQNYTIKDNGSFSCDSFEYVHEHNMTWKYDDDHHWKECSCGEQTEKETHIKGEGVTVTEPTDKSDGEITYSCTECGYVMERKIIHKYSDEWKSDETGHWKECSCGERDTVYPHGNDEDYTGIVTEEATSEKDGVRTYYCKECGYAYRTEPVKYEHVHAAYGEWVNDETYHWHICECGEEGVTFDKAEHTSDSGTVVKEATETEEGLIRYCCTVCGAQINEVTIPVISANEGKCGDDLFWAYDNGTLTISGTGTMYDYAFESRAPWYKYSTQITKIIVQNGAESIGNVAFYNLIALTEISLPNSLESIGECAFSNCTLLTEISVPDNVSTIYSSAFSSCIKLETIKLPKKLTALSDWMFHSCYVLKDIQIPDNVTYIGKLTFYHCESLTSIVIPDNVTMLDNGAFGFCKNLSTVILGKNVESINPSAFDCCYKLKSINIPNSVNFIGNCAFLNCYSLITVAIPDGVKAIYGCTFENCTALESISIPQSVTLIEKDAFTNCDNLTHIHIPYGKTASDYSARGGLPTDEDLFFVLDENEYCPAVNCPMGMNKPHQHDFSNEYYMDSGYHWHQCECGEKTDYENHQPGAEATEDTAQICTVCGYEIASATGHIHKNHLTQIDAVPETCTTDGTKGHFKCNCGKLFADDQAVEEVSAESLRITAHHTPGTEWLSDNDGHYHLCTVCGEKTDYGEHQPGAEATEDAAQICTVCGYEITSATGHIHKNHLTQIDAVPETCTTDGTKGHFKCDCGKLFADDQAAEEVSAESLRITAHHTPGTEWLSDNDGHYHLCTVCGEKIEIIPHNYDSGVITTMPTEQMDGEKTYICSMCNYQKIEIIPKIEHTHSYGTVWESDSEKHWHECLCGDKTETAFHTEDAGFVTVQPTDTTEGTRTYSCSVCGALIRTESIPVLTAVKVAAPSFAVKGVFGGRNVTFNSTTPGATIYYTTEGRSTLKLTDPHVAPGETVLFKAYYGTVYARAYYNGKWSNPARLILKIPKVNTPSITKLDNGKYKIKSSTPGTIVYYTIDGTTPSATNYKGKFWTSHDVSIPAGKTVKAIAVRTCFSDSDVATAKT